MPRRLAACTHRRRLRSGAAAGAKLPTRTRDESLILTRRGGVCGRAARRDCLLYLDDIQVCVCEGRAPGSGSTSYYLAVSYPTLSERHYVEALLY